MEVASVSPTFTLYTNPNKVTLLNSSYPAPYNNLGIPGIVLADAFKRTTAESYSKSPYIDLILRGKGSPLEQALSMAPTFISIWLGNNDVLGFATSGGFVVKQPTSESDFILAYNGIALGIQQFKSQTNSNPGVVVANIPNVTTIPFFTTVGPQMAAGIPWGSLTLQG